MSTTHKTSPELDVSRLKYENDNIKIILNQIINEYADYRIECDEICKEYEETIQLLTDSVEKYKLEITKLNSEKEKMKADQEKLNKDLEKSREKNKEKLKDIEILNNKLDQLQSQFKSSNKNQTTLKSKVVTLETDNDHYLNKIHQYEEEVSDLKNNLENTFESLITTQNDFEEYKNKKEEEIERLKLKLQEEKGNVTALISRNEFRQHKRLKSCFNGQKIEDEELKNDDEVNIIERKLSWNEHEHIKTNSPKKINEKNINKKNDYNEVEKKQEYAPEFGKCRISRAMTIQKGPIKFGDVLTKLRRRKNELVKLNKKIKKEADKILTK